MKRLLFGSGLRDDLFAAILATRHADAMRNLGRSAVGAGLNHRVVLTRLLHPRRALVSSTGWAATSFLKCLDKLRRGRFVPVQEGNFKPLSAARRGSMGFSQVQVPVFRSIPHWGQRPLQDSLQS